MTLVALEGRVDVMVSERLTTTEAVCRLCWHLFHGEGMTTSQAAQLIGYGHEGARVMLCRMSLYLPISQDDRGVWQLTVLDEQK